MESLILFGISYLVLFTIYLIFFYFLGLKKKSILRSMQVEFLKIRFGFRNKDLNSKRIALLIIVVDPLIISLTGVIVSLPKWNYVVSLIIGFVLLIALIYSFYEIIGRILRRKVDKNV